MTNNMERFDMKIHRISLRYGKMSLTVNPKPADMAQALPAFSNGTTGNGLDTDEHHQMEVNVTNIDYDYANEMETKVRHDVMAHVHAYGKSPHWPCPTIHLSQILSVVLFGDNTDLIQIKRN
jgi:adenylosuccinate lyase